MGNAIASLVEGQVHHLPYAILLFTMLERASSWFQIHCLYSHFVSLSHELGQILLCWSDAKHHPLDSQVLGPASGMALGRPSLHPADSPLPHIRGNSLSHHPEASS